MSRTPLGDQLATGFMSAISKGRIKPGEVLPSIRTLAALYGISDKAPRKAVARLAREGWVAARPGVGSVVLRRGADIKDCGRILVYVTGVGGDYYPSKLMSRFSDCLAKAGYRVFSMTAPSRRDRSYSRLVAKTLKGHWDLVLSFGANEYVNRAIDETGQKMGKLQMDAYT